MTSESIRFIHGRRVRSAGFSLVELAMVLAIVALLFVFVMPTSSVILHNKKRELTKQKLTNIETALVNYVAVNKRLPCPASVVAPLSGDEGGRTSGDCTDNQAGGVVPWVAIGLTKSDVEDGWNRLVTYKAAYALTRDGALDMSACDPAGSGPTDGTASPGGKCVTPCVSSNMSVCTSPQSYLLGKGFVVRLGSDSTLIMDPANYTGAAFVLISHGQSGYGAHRSDGSYQSESTTGTIGSIESYNVATVQVTSALPTSANAFRDADFSEGAASEYFDDQVIRPSVFSIIQRAHLGPRSH